MLLDYVIESDLRYEWTWLILEAVQSFTFSENYVSSRNVADKISNANRALIHAFEVLPEGASEIQFWIEWSKRIGDDTDSFREMITQMVYRLKRTINPYER